MNLNDISTQLLFTTVPIWTETSKGEATSATGFIFGVRASEMKDAMVPLLVTNHHVVADARRGVVEFVLAIDGRPDPKSRVKVEIEGEVLRRHINESLDLAAIALGPILNQLMSQNRPAFFRSVDSALVPSAEKLAELSAVEDILLIGYPSGLRDSVNASPISRRGITATPVWNDFEGEPAFLIDAGVFPGSSGSPVFILNQGAYTTPVGLTVGNRLVFLGVLSQALQRPEASGRAYLGLGKVIRSDAVRSFLDQVAAQFRAKV